MLGSGVNTGFIYGRGGTHRLFEVPSTTGVSWGRALSDISTASTTSVPPKTGEDRQRCCELLGRVEPWQHELVVYRDGLRVWEGPVTGVKETGGVVTVDAKDVLGWTKRRAVVERVTTVAESVITETDLVLTRAFATHDPNVLTHREVITTGTPTQIIRDVRALSTYYSDDLAALAEQGMNYTVAGRRVIVWNDTQILGTLTSLVPSKHLNSEVEFHKDGMTLATRVLARNDNDESGTSEAVDMVGVDAYYGLLEWVETAGTTVGSVALTDVAKTIRRRAYPLPLRMVVPDGATLNCDAPFDIQHLIPGTMIPVKEQGLCWDVDQSMVLTGLTVTSQAGTETVAVTLGPLTSAAVGE